MKKIILILAISFGITLVSLAQDPATNPKIEAARIALITERLNLTPEQAEKFWPVYKEYTNKRREIMLEFRQRTQGVDPNTVSDEEAKRLVQIQLERKQKELNLEKQYSEKILNVISTRQLVSLRQAEQDFRRIIYEKIKQRQMQRQQNMQRQNNQRRNN